MGRSMRATDPGPGRRALRPGHGWRDRLPAARPHRPRGLPHLGRRMDRRPPAARRRGRRPRREGGHLVGARQSRRCAGGAAHDDRACRCCCNRTRCARRSRPMCWAARTASCWMPTTTASGMADVQCFEMEELMHSKAAVMAVLHYLFARFDERFDGAPTLLILDEAWLFLDDPVFAARIRQWLKTLRKKRRRHLRHAERWRTSRIRASRPRSSKAAQAGSFCRTRRRPSRRFARSTRASASTARQIEIVATAQPKRDYYYQSRLGNRLFDLDLGPAALRLRGRIPRRKTSATSTACCCARRHSRLRGRVAAPSRPRLGGRPAALVPRPRAGFPSLTTPRRTCHEEAPSRRRHRGRALHLPPPMRNAVVIEPTNLVQNTLTAIRTLEQINNQIQPASERSADADEPGAQPRQPAVQRGRPVARQPGDDRAADRPGARLGLRRDESGSGVRAPVPGSSAPPPSAATRCTATPRSGVENTLGGLQTTMQMQAQASQNLER